MAAAASAGALSVTITGVDRASAVFDRIGKAVQRTQAPFGRLARGVKALADASGVTRLASALGRVAQAARNTAGSLVALVPPLAALTGAASAAGVYRLADAWARFGAQLGRDAYRVQATVAGLHALQGAARLAGGSGEALTEGLRSLGDTLVDAAGGRNMEALGYLNLLGVALRDASGEVRTASDVLPELADRIARIRNPALQARVATQFLGGAAEALLPFLRRGAEGMREYEAMARRYGVVNERAAETAQRFRQAQTRLMLAGEGLFHSIAERLAPVLIPLLDRLSGWIAANRELIAAGLGEWVERVAAALERWLKNGGLERLGESVADLARGIQSVVQWMGRWETAAVALGAVLTANLLAPLTLIAARLTAIAAFRAPVWMLRLLGLAGLGAAAGVALGMRPGQANAGEREELERITRDPEALRREREGTGLHPRSPPDLINRLIDSLGGLFRRQTTPGGGQAALPRGAREATAAALFDGLVRAGFSPAAAAGILANAHAESSFDPAAIGDNGASAGLFQWNGPRRAAFRAFAGVDPSEAHVETQLRFLLRELSGEGGDEGARRAGELLRRPDITAAEAAAIFSRLYERPAAGEFAARSRAAAAEVFLRRFGGRDVAPAPAPAAAAPAGRVEVEVRLRGAPPGTATDVRTTGEGVSATARVERAFPGIAVP